MQRSHPLTFKGLLTVFATLAAASIPAWLIRMYMALGGLEVEGYAKKAAAIQTVSLMVLVVAVVGAAILLGIQFIRKYVTGRDEIGFFEVFAIASIPLVALVFYAIAYANMVLPVHKFIADYIASGGSVAAANYALYIDKYLNGAVVTAQRAMIVMGILFTGAAIEPVASMWMHLYCVWRMERKTEH